MQTMLTLAMISLVASTLGSVARPLAGGTCVPVLVTLKTEEDDEDGLIEQGDEDLRSEEGDEDQLIRANGETTVSELFDSIEREFDGRLPSALSNLVQRKSTRVTIKGNDSNKWFMEERSSALLAEVGFDLSDAEESKIIVKVVDKEIWEDPNRFLIEIAVEEVPESGYPSHPGRNLIVDVVCAGPEIPPEIKKKLGEMESWINTHEAVLENEYDDLTGRLNGMFKACPKHYFVWSHVGIERLEPFDRGYKWKIWVEVVRRDCESKE